MTSKWILLALLIAGALLLIPLLSANCRARRRCRRHFWDLARASELSSAESKWLWQFASAAQLDHPALVFVRPSLFESSATTSDTAATLAVSVGEKLFAKSAGSAGKP